jgi:hypothetical protein
MNENADAPPKFDDVIFGYMEKEIEPVNKLSILEEIESLKSCAKIGL